MHFKTRVLAVASLAMVAAASHAQNQYFTHYDITLTDQQPVTNIMMFEQGSNWGATTWAFQANALPNTQPTVLNNPFPQSTPATSSLLIGLTANLPGDAAGQEHVVLMMDNYAASLSANIAWGTLFRNTDEDTLINDIQQATSGGSWAYITPYLNDIDTFVGGDAVNGIIEPGGVGTASAWFATGGAFTVETWSNGQTIGTGTSSISSVPEPGCFGIVGLGFVGLLLRRRR